MHTYRSIVGVISIGIYVYVESLNVCTQLVERLNSGQICP